MTSPSALLVLVLGACMTLMNSAWAIDCGSVPPVIDETLKGAIEGKANVLSRLLGDAALSGEIDTAKNDIFFKYPDADKTRINAYFLYIMCQSVFNDNTLTEPQKRDEFSRIRQEILKPPSLSNPIVKPKPSFKEIGTYSGIIIKSNKNGSEYWHAEISIGCLVNGKRCGYATYQDERFEVLCQGDWRYIGERDEMKWFEERMLIDGAGKCRRDGFVAIMLTDGGVRYLWKPSEGDSFTTGGNLSREK